MRGLLLFSACTAAAVCLSANSFRSRKSCKCTPVLPTLKVFCRSAFISLVQITSYDAADLYPNSNLTHPIVGVRYKVIHREEYRNMMNNTGNMKSRLPEYILTPAKKDPCSLNLKAGKSYILAGVLGHGADYEYVRSNRCGILKRWKWKKYLEYFRNEDCLKEDEEYFSYE